MPCLTVVTLESVQLESLLNEFDEKSARSSKTGGTKSRDMVASCQRTLRPRVRKADHPWQSLSTDMMNEKEAAGTQRSRAQMATEGVVWCGVVWCGVVWCGVVWCGVGWGGAW